MLDKTYVKKPMANNKLPQHTRSILAERKFEKIKDGTFSMTIIRFDMQGLTKPLS